MPGIDVLRFFAVPRPEALGVDSTGPVPVQEAAVADGSIGYLPLVAHRP